jgi:hypothetical protein
MLDFKLTTFTFGDTTHEAIRVSDRAAATFLGFPYQGPRDDERLRQGLVAAGAPAWVANSSALVGFDDQGWHVRGPEVAEPLLDSELEDFNGDHVVIDDETYAVDTDEQISAVARMLHRLDLPEQPVWRGSAPDTVKTSLVVVPRA